MVLLLLLVVSFPVMLVWSLLAGVGFACVVQLVCVPARICAAGISFVVFVGLHIAPLVNSLLVVSSFVRVFAHILAVVAIVTIIVAWVCALPDRC